MDVGQENQARNSDKETYTFLSRARTVEVEHRREVFGKVELRRQEKVGLGGADWRLGSREHSARFAHTSVASLSPFRSLKTASL